MKTGDLGYNEALVRSGYLGSAPLAPTVAISLKVLEAYRQQHRFCPRLSVYAQVKALCSLHQVKNNCCSSKAY